MLKVTYDAYEGQAFPDGEVRDQALRFWENRDKQPEVVVSTGIIINCFRLLISKGVIPADELTFFFDGKSLFCDEQGFIHDWPEGFDDINEGILMELLGWRAEKKTQIERSKNLADTIVDKKIVIPDMITWLVKKVLENRHIEDGFVIPCIKELRNQYGSTLMSSKVFVDEWRAEIIAEIESQSDEYHYSKFHERFFKKGE